MEGSIAIDGTIITNTEETIMTTLKLNYKQLENWAKTVQTLKLRLHNLFYHKDLD